MDTIISLEGASMKDVRKTIIILDPPVLIFSTVSPQNWTIIGLPPIPPPPLGADVLNESLLIALFDGGIL